MHDAIDAPQMMDLSLAAFTDALAGDSAAPGGGAAAALAGALGAALAAMVARLTVGRPRYAATEPEMTSVCEQADALRGRLLSLVDADCAAFTGVMAAYRLPKSTAEEQAGRTSAIQAALRNASAVPLAVAGACADVLTLVAIAAVRGNRNAAGDAAAAALLAHAGLLVTLRNVRINLRGIEDPAYRAEISAHADRLLAAGDAALAAALEAADHRA